MAYTPTEWQSGDIVTSEKLNNMEQGIAAAGVVEVLFEAAYAEGATLPTITCDHTAEEIVAAKEAGKHVVCSLRYDTSSSLYICVEQTIERDVTPYVVVKFLEHVANASAATSDDFFGFISIDWDSGNSTWTAQPFYYAMTPMP